MGVDFQHSAQILLKKQPTNIFTYFYFSNSFLSNPSKIQTIPPSSPSPCQPLPVIPPLLLLSFSHKKSGVLILGYNKSMGKFSNWSKQQDEILLEALQTAKSKKWIKTSQKLQEKGHLRSPSECRQRYINYLAPDIDKREITQEQLELIYTGYEQFGPKWSTIQQMVRCKTQCKIKNVFYGNVKNLLKTAYKYFTLKTSPFFNTIPTDFLQMIYDGSLQFDGMRQAHQGIKAMKYRNDKSALIRDIQKDREGYLMLVNTVLKEVFKKGPIQCKPDQVHQKRIEKLMHEEKMIAEQEDGKETVKFQEQSQEEYMGSQQENKPQDTGSNNVKIETSEIQAKLEASPLIQPVNSPSQQQKQDMMIFPFAEAANSEKIFMNPFPIVGSFFQYPFFFPQG